MPAATLRRIVALQSELMKDAPKKRNVSHPTVAVNVRQPTTQRTLLSANFGPIVNPLQNGAKAANLLGRSVISAGDRLRDLIIPDALASVVTGSNWLPGMGTRPAEKTLGNKKLEAMRAELEDVLSSSCPLCDSVVAGLDRPFVLAGEGDSSWSL